MPRYILANIVDIHFIFTTLWVNCTEYCTIQFIAPTLLIDSYERFWAIRNSNQKGRGLVKGQLRF